jgi:ATP-dependent DNA helicase RecG
LLSKPTTIEQIDAWRAAKSETEHLEFKEAKNQFDSESLLEYCVAMANERGGVLLLGIANRPPRPVVGTNAFRNIVKTTEDIFFRLHFRVDVEEVQHPDGRVLVFHIPSRPDGHPYELDGSYYMRSGESLVAMTTDQIKQIIAEGRSSTRRGTVIALASVFILGMFGWLWANIRTQSTILGSTT